MILEQQHDTSRIGGGIGDAIEQVSDNTFNWLTQLYYVFYDEEHFAVVMGNTKAVEYVTLSQRNLTKKLVVSVSPDSMRPKDDVTNINLAQALYDKGAIGPKTLLKMVDFPDPDAAAEDGALWITDKMAYIRINFPEMFAHSVATLRFFGCGCATEPQQNIAQNPADAALSQVQLPPIPAQ